MMLKSLAAARASVVDSGKTMDVDADAAPPSPASPAAAHARPPPGPPPQQLYHLPDDEERFTIELEFVQCLANPDYLHWLALNKYLEDPAFVRFAKYLAYWRRPEYARFLLYPHCLAILDLLGKEEFRREMTRQPFKDFLQEQQLLQWRYYLNNRRRCATTPSGGDWEGRLHELPSAAAAEEEGEPQEGQGAAAGVVKKEE